MENNDKHDLETQYCQALQVEVEKIFKQLTTTAQHLQVGKIDSDFAHSLLLSAILDRASVEIAMDVGLREFHHAQGMMKGKIAKIAFHGRQPENEANARSSLIKAMLSSAAFVIGIQPVEGNDLMIDAGALLHGDIDQNVAQRAVELTANILKLVASGDPRAKIIGKIIAPDSEVSATEDLDIDNLPEDMPDEVKAQIIAAHKAGAKIGMISGKMRRKPCNDPECKNCHSTTTTH